MKLILFDVSTIIIPRSSSILHKYFCDTFKLLNTHFTEAAGMFDRVTAKLTIGFEVEACIFRKRFGMACGMTAAADKTHRANVLECYELTH